jgi:Rrf2 family protein
MKVTAKEEAGLIVMAHLARMAAEGPVSLKAVAEESGITLKYLEKVVPDLRKEGLIESERGVNGGYFLTRQPQEITLAETLVALNGDILSQQCIGMGLEDDPCPRMGDCPVHPVWNLLYQRLEDTLSGITLNDLA